MRGVLFFAVFTGGLWLLDTLVFDGRNTRAIWQEAKAAGQSFRYELKVQLDHLNLF